MYKRQASKTFINFMANSDETAKAVKTSTYFSVKNSLSDLYAADEVMNEYQKLMPYLGDVYKRQAPGRTSGAGSPS